MFERHPIYALTHIGTGFLAYWYPIIGILAILYQFAQYSLNIRFFLFEMTIRQGNSFKHTAVKLLEMAFGFVLAYGVNQQWV